MAFALSQLFEASLRRSAALLILLGEDSARLIMNELDPHERALLASSAANLSPVSLGEQTVILREFAEEALNANASLFGDVSFAEAIMKPIPPAPPATGQ